MANGIVRFSEFELDRGRYELRRGDRTLKLEKIPMDLLLLLVDADGHLVTRDEIIERIWGKDVFVDTEHGINTAIRKIRLALKDDPDQPRFVQTVTGKGYRFIAPVTVEPHTPANGNGASGAAAGTIVPPVANLSSNPATAPVPPPDRASAFRPIAWAILGVLVVVATLVAFNVRGLRDRLRPQPAKHSIQSLAVLPLENLSGDPKQEYFADGMTDEIITMLAKNPSLRVVSRTSVMQYKGAHRPLRDIARELGVEGILEGSVERQRDRVHLNAQLIHAGATVAVTGSGSLSRGCIPTGRLANRKRMKVRRRMGSL